MSNLLRDEALPGVTLYLKTSTVRKLGLSSVADVSLNAHITDMDVWKGVEAQLREGIRIYTVNDFKTEILKVLRADNERLTDEVQTARSLLEERALRIDLLERMLKSAAPHALELVKRA